MKKAGIGVFLVLCSLLTTGCWLFRPPAPDGTAEAYLQELTAGQYADMYQKLSADSKLIVGETSFISYYEKIYQEIGVNKIQLTMVKPAEGEKWEIKDNRVDIPVVGTMETWTVGEFNLDQTLHMVYQDKAWRIDWMASNILPQMQELTDHVVVSRTTAERGNIYDRNGEFIVGPGTTYQIGLVPKKIENHTAAVDALAVLLDMPQKRIEQNLQQKWVRPDTFVPLRSITKAEWLEKKEQFLAIKGVLASASSARVYSGPPGLGPVIGYLGEVNKQELAEWQQEGYQTGDWVGRDGLERMFEKYLAGKPGFMLRVLDAAGKERSIIKFTRPQKGNDLFLTIDLKLQRLMDKSMGERKGVGLALKPKTGEILAVSSYPGYDPNEFILGSSSTRVAAILKDPAKPLINRAFQSRYIPGSTFKPLTALAALEFDPAYDAGKKVDLPKATWQPAKEYWGNYVVKRVPRPAGPVDLEAAMKWSDNIYFAQLAYNMGSEPLFKIAERAGFEKAIPFMLDLPQSILAPERPIKSSVLLADTGYGQGKVLVTPLHMAMIYAAIAQDGKVRKPFLRSTEELGALWLEEPLASPEHLALIRDVLKTAVQDEKALAHDADIPGLDIAGKTGTAQTTTSETGWFISYHPASDPEMVLLFAVEEAVKGSHDAIDITVALLREYYGLEVPTE